MNNIDSWIEQSLLETNALSSSEKLKYIYNEANEEFSMNFGRLNIKNLQQQSLQIDLKNIDNKQDANSKTTEKPDSYVYAYGELREPANEHFKKKKNKFLKESNKKTNPIKIVQQKIGNNMKNISFDDKKFFTHQKIYFKEKFHLSEHSIDEIDDSEANFGDNEESDSNDLNSYEGDQFFEMEEDLELKETKINSSVNSKSMCSLILPDTILKDIHSEIIFYEDIYSIEDKTWLPRHFQNHRLTLKTLLNQDSMNYYINKACPKSSGCTDNPFYDLKKDDLKNLSTYRYSRCSNLTNTIEVMCRLCRGINWVEKKDFSTHLSLSHGVLTNFKCHTINLIPLPKSLLKLKRGKFIDFQVSCGKCNEWIILGNLPNDLYERKQSFRTLGLYHKYYEHFIKNHRKDLY